MIYFRIADFIIKVIYYDYQSNKYIFDAYHKFIKKELGLFLTKKTSKVDLILNINSQEAKIIRNKSFLFCCLLVKKSHVYYTHTTLSVTHFYNVIEEIIRDLFDKAQDIILHCSAVEYNNQAYVFLGESGSGKSTMISLLKSKFRPLSDDIALIRKKGDKFFLYQTPTKERNNYPLTLKKYPLKNIFFIKKSAHNSIMKTELNNRRIQQLFVKGIRNRVVKNTVANFIGKYQDHFYYFSFVKNESASQYLLNFIKSRRP